MYLVHNHRHIFPPQRMTKNHEIKSLSIQDIYRIRRIEMDNVPTGLSQHRRTRR